MIIWYNDDPYKNRLTYFVDSARKIDSSAIRRANHFDVSESSEPDYFIINPTHLPMGDYWEDTRKYIDSHPNTEFVFTFLGEDNMEEAREVGLDSLDNVGLFDNFSSKKRLTEILTELYKTNHNN